MVECGSCPVQEVAGQSQRENCENQHTETSLKIELGSQKV